jgi:hypothetical protein
VKYKLSYTAASLMLNESLKIAELYDELRDWDSVLKTIIEENTLQKNKESTIKREFRELRERLEKLTPSQFETFLNSDASSQRLLLFLGICKLYKFIGDFVVEIIRNKALTFEYILTESDYIRFFDTKANQYSNLETITASTQYKLKSTLFLILQEVGLINNRKEKWITPPIITGRIADVVIEESPELLKFWLVSNLDMERMKKQSENAA